MNVIEKQTELTKSLYEINTNALREFASLQQENIQKYFAVNREFGEKLPEVKDVSSFVALQREYGETMWNNVKESFEHQTALLRSTLEETRDAVKTAFASAETAEKPKAKAKAKSRAKAKKPAEAAA